MQCSFPRAGLAIAASMALIAACAHSDPKAPVGLATVTVLPTLTADQTRGLVSVPWRVTGRVGSIDVLFLEVPAAGCPRPRGAIITESPTDVTVQIYATTMPDCSDAPIGYVVAPVRLTAPLGTRHLRHGPAVSGPPGQVGADSGEPNQGGAVSGRPSRGPFRPGGGRQ